MASKVSISIKQHERDHISKEVRKQISKVYKQVYNKLLNIEEVMRKLNKHLICDVVKAYKETLDTVHADAIEYLPRYTKTEIIHTIECQRIRIKSSEGENNDVSILTFNRPKEVLLSTNHKYLGIISTPYTTRDLVVRTTRRYDDSSSFSYMETGIWEAIENITGKYIKDNTIPNITHLKDSEGECIFNTFCLDELLSDETKQLLNLFKEAAEKIDKTITEPVNTLLDEIEWCVSTKRFEDELPELVNLWPASVRQRYDEANGDLSEDDLHIKEAINLYTAGKLLDK